MLSQRVQGEYLEEGEKEDGGYFDARMERVRGWKNLSGEDSGPLESLAEQIDLGYHAAIRHHHRDRPEHGFQIVGQLGTTRVSWIHSDEDAAGVHQFYFRSFEHESDDLLREGGEY